MKQKLIISSLLVLVLSLTGGVSALASGTWYVNGVRGSDSNNCKSPQTACKTISHAISLASSGDTISVAAATYRENLTIGMSLTIHGDYATSAPTIIDGGGVNTVLTIPNADSVVSVSDMSIQNGYSDTLWGAGGIYNQGTLYVSRVVIAKNNADYDAKGGIHNHGMLIISKSTITMNTVLTGTGGGVVNTGTLTAKDITISGNIAGSCGGILNYGVFTIGDSTVSGNDASWAGEGGGLCNNGTLTINNSTISGNTASYAGGGIIHDLGTTAIANSTLSGNSAAQDGGGIYIKYGGTVTLQNSIVANSASGGNCYISSGNITSNGYNLSSDGTCPFNNTGDLNNTDPKLGPLQNNGGPTLTQALLDGSPAIDAGNPNGCTDGNGNLLKTDQRGFPRPDPEDPSGCDMGAYERQGD